jgi:phosphoribosylaminoimidazolecarboxamide formyltransferase/IMP cyclohydrolase
MTPIRRALLSVSDKRGLVAFAQGLRAHGVELLSTGGTADALRAGGLRVTEVSAVTGLPEMLDGRVKTLHPAIHAGLLAVRGNPAHEAQLAAQGIPPLDLVAVNLYPFEATIAKADVSLHEAIEQIDIGGPALLRAAGKNFEGAAAVVDPDDYAGLLAEMGARGGGLSRPTRFALARKAFAHTACYDAAIAAFLERAAPGLDAALQGPGSEPTAFPSLLQLRFAKVQDLRYGENPHQRAALYRELPAGPGLAAALQLQGKELSYNNLLDLQAAWELVQDFDEPAVAIVKHTNPCGVAVGSEQAAAFLRARETDPLSAFGGIIAVNRPLEASTAEAITTGFIEVIVAPAVAPEAQARLRERKALRVVQAPAERPDPAAPDFRRIAGGLLAQDPDRRDADAAAWAVRTQRAPTPAERHALQLAWRVAKHVKSNAIVLATPEGTVGIGAGQMSRVDAVRLAISKAVLPTRGSALASDAFFPFRDGVDAAAAAGVSAIVQPGGSIRDGEVAAAADEHGLTMLCTGVRHFRH